MLKGDCNECLHGNEPEDSEVCIECGIARKNYEEKIMTEYISREALPEKKERGFFSDDEFNAGWNACLNAIASTPAADVAPVIHAYWIELEKGDCKCSRCGCYHDVWEAYGYYCQHCGAKMDAKMERSKEDDV